MEESKKYLEDIYNNIKDVIKETKDKSKVSFALIGMTNISGNKQDIIISTINSYIGPIYIKPT